jgi:hypothetical protein
MTLEIEKLIGGQYLNASFEVLTVVRMMTLFFWVITPRRPVQSAGHELIYARNASLAAMQVSASGSNVRY